MPISKFGVNYFLYDCTCSSSFFISILSVFSIIEHICEHIKVGKGLPMSGPYLLHGVCVVRDKAHHPFNSQHLCDIIEIEGPIGHIKRCWLLLMPNGLRQWASWMLLNSVKFSACGSCEVVVNCN